MTWLGWLLVFLMCAGSAIAGFFLCALVTSERISNLELTIDLQRRRLSAIKNLTERIYDTP